jgi:hypothetical protein
MRYLLLVFLSLSVTTEAHSQDLDSVTLSKLKLNFVVPDMPAFKALGTEPSDLLRPSTPQAFAVSVSEFYQNRQFVLPEAFAVEITPALLLNANKGLAELQEYARHRVANSFRLSIGTASDTSLSTSGRNLSLGMRINLINKGDMVTDAEYLAGISEALGRFRQQVRSGTLIEFAREQKIDMTQVDWEYEIFGNPQMKQAFDAYLANEEEASQQGFSVVLDSLKDDYKKRNWNATKLDVALAVLSTSADSLIRSIRFNRTQLWVACALRAGRSGQLILGINSQISKDLRDTVSPMKDDIYFDLAIPVRYLIGTNRVKGFAEAAYSYSNRAEENKIMFHVGTEVNPLDGLWLNFYAGVDYSIDSGNAAFITNLDLKITLPERFNFF